MREGSEAMAFLFGRNPGNPWKLFQILSKFLEGWMLVLAFFLTPFFVLQNDALNPRFLFVSSGLSLSLALSLPPIPSFCYFYPSLLYLPYFLHILLPLSSSGLIPIYLSFPLLLPFCLPPSFPAEEALRRSKGLPSKPSRS